MAGTDRRMKIKKKSGGSEGKAKPEEEIPPTCLTRNEFPMDLHYFFRNGVNAGSAWEVRGFKGYTLIRLRLRCKTREGFVLRVPCGEFKLFFTLRIIRERAKIFHNDDNYIEVGCLQDLCPKIFCSHSLLLYKRMSGGHSSTDYN